MSVGSVKVARPVNQREGGGASPTPALQDLFVKPVPNNIARSIVERHHCLHSFPGATKLAFGVFVGFGLQGAVVLGCGPVNAYSLVSGANPDDCLALTRLWLSDDLPGNSESKVIGSVIRALKRHTHTKFLVTYADPTQGHVGTIYQATNWFYTGLSGATPLYAIGDGKAVHSRTFANTFGTHSVAHFEKHGVELKKVPQAAKHRYLYFLDRSWRNRLHVPIRPYPKKED